MDKNTDAIIIREIERKDHTSVADIWRITFQPVADKSVSKICEQMKNDSRYHIFVAEYEWKNCRSCYNR